MRKITIWVILLFLISVAQAFPLLPSQYYGTLTMDGYYAPPGTEVSIGTSNTEICGSTIIQRVGYYSISCNGDNPSTSIIEGPKQGQVVEFFVNEQSTSISQEWKEGLFTRVDFDAESKIVETKAPEIASFEDDIALIWVFLGLLVFVIYRLRKVYAK